VRCSIRPTQPGLFHRARPEYGHHARPGNTAAGGRNFLGQHHIDPGEFEGQVQVITYSTQKNINTGNISGTGIVIGDKSAVTNAGNVQAPPNPATAAKGVT